MQYDIREEELDDILRRAQERTLLKLKLADVSVLYRSFEYLSGHYMTGEEMLDVLVRKLSQSKSFGTVKCCWMVLRDLRPYRFLCCRSSCWYAARLRLQ